MKSSLGLQYLLAVLADGNTNVLAKSGSIEHLFLEHELPVYEYIRMFAANHGALPTLKTVDQHVGLGLTTSPTEPSSYYLDHMRQRFVDRGLNVALDAAKIHLLPGQSKDPRAALASLVEHVWAIQQSEASTEITDFRNAFDPIMTQYVQKATGQMIGIEMGWPTLDELSGGLVGGDLVSIVGRPAKGKTWKVLYSAHDVWWRQKLPVLVLTMEMKAHRIMQRLAALHAHVPGMQLKLGQLTTTAKDKLKHSLATLKGAEHPLWIVDGGMKMSADRLRLITQQLQPAIVYVDGAYMLRHPDRSLTRFRRIDAVAEDLKDGISTDLDLPVVASWQFNRQKIAKAEKGVAADDVQLTIDDIYGSDVIGQASSIVLGLFQPETVENLHQKVMTILKGREGERGEFPIRWDFDQMNFNEILPEHKGELDYEDEELPHV